jgi:catechol-2,3-dioxygenase
MSARLGRIHLNVRDLGRAARFYTQVLGLRVSTRAAGLVFLTSGSPHHDLVLCERPETDPAPPIVHGVGTVGFEVRDRYALAEVCNRLERAGAPVTPMDQGISLSLFTADPDGNSLEVYCDTRHEPTGRQVWTGEARAMAASEIADPAAGAALRR